MTRLRHVTDLGEAMVLAPRLDRAVAERAAEFQDEAVPPGVCHDWLERFFDARETLLVVAETEDGRADEGYCLTGPFEEPLIGTRVPLVLVLHVEAPARHRGVARALVGHVSTLLHQRGMDKLAARAGHNDDALISMGERWGFVRHWELMLRE